MSQIDPEAARSFSIEVVVKLRAAGHVAYWAGGCVRDKLLGLTPKDYDVATDATPEKIREIFTRRRTLALGAAFGVISVLGPKPAGHVEVATFREDAQYSDGRHPDAVRFSTAEADAQRRDFTINGMFYDPIAEKTIDFVGGERDLKKGIVRAIGEPAERIREDKLRMLRAIRFAAVFNFKLDAETLRVIQESADQISVVSPERISQELRRMLGNANRRRAAGLLIDSGLLAACIPELQPHLPDGLGVELASIEALPVECANMLPLALLLRPLYVASGVEHISQIGAGLRLARDEIEVMKHVLVHEPTVRAAKSTFWPTVQRVLASRRVNELLDFAEALAQVEGAGIDDVAFCRAKIALPAEEWNPATLINGNDLHQMGLGAGPRFKELLDEVRDRQLLGEMQTREQALKWVRGQMP